jgi:hypothetical protein
METLHEQCSRPPAEFRQQYARPSVELKNKNRSEIKSRFLRVFAQIRRPQEKRVAITGNAIFLPLGETLGRPTLGQTAGGPRSFTESVVWRKGWDSNPRWSFPHGGFQDRCLKPLGHPSMAIMRYITFAIRARAEVYGSGVKR